MNTALIDLCWRAGAYIPQKVMSAASGDGVVGLLAASAEREHPDHQGFSRPNLFRRKQFHEAYGQAENV